jgi:hypothetical protein
MKLLALKVAPFSYFVLHPPNYGTLKVENVPFDRLWQHQDLDTGHGSDATCNDSRIIGPSREESISRSRAITVGTVSTTEYRLRSHPAPVSASGGYR